MPTTTNNVHLKPKYDDKKQKTKQKT